MLRRLISGIGKWFGEIPSEQRSGAFANASETTPSETPYTLDIHFPSDPMRFAPLMNLLLDRGGFRNRVRLSLPRPEVHLTLEGSRNGESARLTASGNDFDPATTLRLESLGWHASSTNASYLKTSVVRGREGRESTAEDLWRAAEVFELRPGDLVHLEVHLDGVEDWSEAPMQEESTTHTTIPWTGDPTDLLPTLREVTSRGGDGNLITLEIDRSRSYWIQILGRNGSKRIRGAVVSNAFLERGHELSRTQLEELKVLNWPLDPETELFLKEFPPATDPEKLHDVARGFKDVAEKVFGLRSGDEIAVEAFLGGSHAPPPELLELAAAQPASSSSTSTRDQNT